MPLIIVKEDNINIQHHSLLYGDGPTYISLSATYLDVQLILLDIIQILIFQSEIILRLCG